MFPHATDEVRENNDKFSPCSIKHISKILTLKKDDCFVGEGPTSDKCCFLQSLHRALVTVNQDCDFQGVCLIYCVYLHVYFGQQVISLSVETRL